MAQTLRGGLNEFAGRMEHAGIRAEVWRPGADARRRKTIRKTTPGTAGGPKRLPKPAGTQERESNRKTQETRLGGGDGKFPRRPDQETAKQGD